MPVELILNLITELARAYNSTIITSRASKIADLKKSLLRELSKGQLSDDGLVETLTKEISIECEALLSEVMLANAKR